MAELRGAYQEALVFLDPTIGREEIARRRSAYLEKLAQGSNAEGSSDPLDSCIGDELYALRAYSPELRAAIEKDALGPGSNLDKLLEQQRKGANHLIKLLKAKTSLGRRL